MRSWVPDILRRAWTVGRTLGWTGAQPTESDQLRHLLADLRRSQDALSAKQQDLLEAVTADDERANVLRQEVCGLSELLLEILAQVERALQHATSSPSGVDWTAMAQLGREDRHAQQQRSCP